MKVLKRSEEKKGVETWEEKSGLIGFLSRVSSEVEKFNSITGFGLQSLASPPTSIDGNTGIVSKAGFVVVRDNPILPERRYCLYTVLEDQVLFARTGIYATGRITTLRELGELAEFQKAEFTLYDWLKGLIKASCDK